jgi:hypothetical protein
MKKQVIKDKKKPKYIKLEFVISTRNLTNVNFTINKEGIKRRVRRTFNKIIKIWKGGGEYNKLRFKIIFKYLHLQIAKLYLFLLKEWLWYNKYKLKKEEKNV